MQRVFVLAAMLWLAAFGMAHAQVTPQVTSQATPQVAPPGTAQPVPGGFVAATPGATPGAAATTLPGTNPGTTRVLNVQIRPPCSTPGGFIGGFAAAPCPTDPLNLPTAMLSSAGSAASVLSATTSGSRDSSFGFGAS